MSFSIISTGVQLIPARYLELFSSYKALIVCRPLPP